MDGDGSTPDTNRRWPDALATRLRGEGRRPTSVINEGMIGNRMLYASPRESPFGAVFGESGLSRFDRDALSQPGARYVIVRIGGNDIGMPGSIAPESERVTAEMLIGGYRRLIAQARNKNLTIIGTTIAPFENAAISAAYYSPEKDAVREEVNAWIRGSGEFDGVVDIDQVLRDPARPTRLDPGFDSGDHLHPNDDGYAELARAVPLALFSKH
jgi:lysophospholipase L1-like esterase